MEENVIHHRVCQLEDKHKHMDGELHEVKEAVTSISVQTKVIKDTLVEIKDALTKVASVATDVQLAKLSINKTQQSVHEMKVENEKIHDTVFSKLSDIDKKIQERENKVREELERKEEKLFNEIKETRKEWIDEQKWFKRLIYAAIIMGIFNLAFYMLKSSVEATVIEKQYHIVNNKDEGKILKGK